MKTSQSIACLAAVAVLGFFFGRMESPADAQSPAVPVPRYQIAAWAYAGNPSHPMPKHGYYILDTISGAVWESDANGKPMGISSKLP